jgi:hypothetical protein
MGCKKRNDTGSNLFFARLLVSCAGAILLSVTGCASLHSESGAAEYSVRAFGAKGDGKTFDSPAINRAIEAAAATSASVTAQ